MTHITGPRKKKVDRLAGQLLSAIGMSGCTISESHEAVHEVSTSLLKAALRPLEPFTCPTCPSAGDLTPAQLDRVTSAVRKEMRK